MHANISGIFHGNEGPSNMLEVTGNMKTNPNQRRIIRDTPFLFITKYRHAAFKTSFPMPLIGNQTLHNGLPEQ